MTVEELTQLTALQQTILARYDQWLIGHQAAVTQHDQQMSEIRSQQQLNIQDIASLTASITELRNIVADYIQGRS